VVAGDALAMADALERALEDMPLEEPQDRYEFRDYFETVIRELEAAKRALRTPGAEPADLGLTGEYRGVVGRLIEYCRQGEFQIYWGRPRGGPQTRSTGRVHSALPIGRGLIVS